MARGSGSVIRRRILGRHLRVLREDAGLTLEEAAPQLDMSISTLSRIETAQQSVTVHVVRSMLDQYGAGGHVWTELIELTRASRQPGWWEAYGVGPRAFYVAYEAEARRVLDCTLAYMPGLLQTPDYARALFCTVPIRRTASELENEVALRMIRKRRLTSRDDRLDLEAIIDESALHRPIGGQDVLVGQLCHLLTAGELDAVTVRVVPLAAGGHPFLASGLTILEFGDLGEPDIAYVEHSQGAMIIDKEAEVASARVRFDLLRAAALDQDDSRELIRALLKSHGYRAGTPMAVSGSDSRYGGRPGEFDRA